MPMPVTTTRRAATMGHLSSGPKSRSGAVGAVGEHLRQSQHVLQLAAEDEVVIAKDLLGARFVEMSEKDLRLSHGDLARPRHSSRESPGGAAVDFTANG